MSPGHQTFTLTKNVSYLWKYPMKSFELSHCIKRSELRISFSAFNDDVTTSGILGEETVWLDLTSGNSQEAASSKTLVISRKTIGRMSESACEVQRSGTSASIPTVLEITRLISVEDPDKK